MKKMIIACVFVWLALSMGSWMPRLLAIVNN